jgi:(p)ppGpp synthase/HD superfamily hydrolase
MMNPIDFAIEVAAKAHRNQLRKGTDIPYISHPYAVGLLLLQAGCSEEVIVAGILHDTVEDTPITLEYIREHFGDKVASIVGGCSEPDKSLPWEERKRHTIEFLRTAPPEIRMVTCADKLHNIRTILAEYERLGDEVWKRFKRGREAQEWYFRGLVESISNQTDGQGEGAIFQQFRHEVEKLFGKK